MGPAVGDSGGPSPRTTTWPTTS